MTSGPAVRFAAGELRGRLFRAAAIRLAVQPDELTAEKGVFYHVGAPTGESYWTVAEDIDLNDRITGAFPLKKPDNYTVVGTSPVSSALLKKLSCGAFIHDFALPGMVYGRALRQPHLKARLSRVDVERAQASNGVIAVVHDGNFIGVVAESEKTLSKAMNRIEGLVEWELEEKEAESVLSPLDFLKNGASTSVAVREDFEVRDRNWQYDATFTKPLIGHGSIGPSCAIACFEGARLNLWTHSQDVFSLRAQLARVIGTAESQIIVRHLPGAGCYGQRQNRMARRTDRDRGREWPSDWPRFRSANAYLFRIDRADACSGGVQPEAPRDNDGLFDRRSIWRPLCRDSEGVLS